MLVGGEVPDRWFREELEEAALTRAEIGWLVMLALFPLAVAAELVAQLTGAR